MTTQPSDQQELHDAQPKDPTEFFRALSQEKHKAAPQPIKDSYPRFAGMLLGAALGFVYGLISQGINLVTMPGVPIAQYPFGLVVNCIIYIAGGALVGFACSYPKSSLNGVILGSITSMVVILIQWWAAFATSLSGLFQTDFFVAVAPVGLPFALGLLFLITVPLMLLLRWTIDIQSELSYRSVRSWERLRLPLVILTLSAVAGTLTLYPGNVRQAMSDMHELIQAGLSVSNATDLPRPLREENEVIDFLAYAGSNYTLERGLDAVLRNDLSVLAEADSEVILARFDHDWTLACLYEPDTSRPICKSYVPSSFFRDEAWWSIELSLAF